MHLINKFTLIEPIINRTDMNMVIHKLMARIIFTTHGGKKSKNIVRYSTLTVNITISVAMANRIPHTPDIMDPDRSDWHRQHVFNIGPAILICKKYLKMKDKY